MKVSSSFQLSWRELNVLWRDWGVNCSKWVSLNSWAQWVLEELPRLATILNVGGCNSHGASTNRVLPPISCVNLNRVHGRQARRLPAIERRLQTTESFQKHFAASTSGMFSLSMGHEHAYMRRLDWPFGVWFIYVEAVPEVSRSCGPKRALRAYLDNVGLASRSDECGHFEHGWTSGTAASTRMQQTVKCQAWHRPQANERGPHWTFSWRAWKTIDWVMGTLSWADASQGST